MRRSPLAVQVLVIGALIALPNEGVHAQVGLQVRSDKLWGAVVKVGTLWPVNLRWKWDGVDMPTKVRWALTTQTPAALLQSAAFPQEGLLNLPAKGGVYEEFTVTPTLGAPSLLRTGA